MNLYDEVNTLMEQLTTAWSNVVVVCDGKTCQVWGGIGVLYVAPTLLEALRLATHIQACRVCGCTDENGCPEGCWWVEEDLCSACAEKQGAAPEGGHRK